MGRLRILLVTILIFFPAQAFSREFSPGYATAYRHFPELVTALDKNFDGLLSYDELIDGYHAPYLNKELYQTIRLYLVNFESWQNPVTVSLSRDSIELAELSGQVAKYHHEQDNTFWDAWLAKPERQPYADAYRRLFPHGLTSITPDNLVQRYFPDCVLIASLASIASFETGKRLIFNYFYKTADKEIFSIVFRGSDTNILTRFREVEHHKFAKTRDGGVWLAMLEAAYNHLPKSFIKKYRQNDWSRFDYRKYSELDEVDENQAFTVLMGSNSNYINPQFQSQEQLKEQLNAFVDNEKVVIVAATPSVSTFLKLRPFAEIRSRHAYSLIGYDKEKDIVYIRDPQGQSDATVNIYTINRHIQTLSSGNSEIFEVINSHPWNPEYKLAYGLTESRLNYFLNQTVALMMDNGLMEPQLNYFLNQTAALMMDNIAKGIIPSNIPLSMSTSERSPARTGIIKMTVEQFIDTFNMMFISQCGPYQCPKSYN
ncbi:hypothetical protein [Endozoicomonas sp. 4G]|uniref:hypothetical protein n=1 Tax=Endozoicomonas sp. 4G TaxID=2872754 RepID=UPI002078B936|nr:hypothetical protein [Endozoicomonas sp. 4G]